MLGGLIIRKPGAALFTELVAATVSALLGAQWGGFATIEAGLVQGLGAELVFLLFAYSSWRVWVAMLAGAGAGAAMAINDLVLYYVAVDGGFKVVYAISAVISGALIAGARIVADRPRTRQNRGALAIRLRPGGVGARLTRSTAAAVEARGWGWRHAGRRASAVSGLDLRIDPGERVLLLGASGAGKSTLMHALAGVLGGDDEGDRSGELLVDGRPPAPGRSGLVLQDPDSQVVLARVGDDVAFGCENLGVPSGEIWPRVASALDSVGLGLPLDHPTSSLSGGQKQRLALAGVLAMRPGLLLLDEPTANLDPDGVIEVRDAVARVVADRSVTLDRGRAPGRGVVERRGPGRRARTRWRRPCRRATGCGTRRSGGSPRRQRSVGARILTRGPRAQPRRPAAHSFAR